MICIRCKNEDSSAPFCYTCSTYYDVMYRHMRTGHLAYYDQYLNSYASPELAEENLATYRNTENLLKVSRYMMALGRTEWHKSLDISVSKAITHQASCGKPRENITVNIYRESSSIPSLLTRMSVGIYSCRWNDWAEVRAYLVENYPFAKWSSILGDWKHMSMVASSCERVIKFAGGHKTGPLVVERGQILGTDFVATKSGFAMFKNLFAGATEDITHKKSDMYGSSWKAPANMVNLHILFNRTEFYEDTGIDAGLEVMRLHARDNAIMDGLMWRRQTQRYSPDQLHQYIYNEQTIKGPAYNIFDPFKTGDKKIRTPIPELEIWDKFLNKMKPFSQQKIAAEIAYRAKHTGYWMDMRVGKTPTSMMVMRRTLLEKEVRAWIVVAPAVNCFDPWFNELNKQGWFNVVCLDEGAAIDELNLRAGTADVYIISYDTLVTRQKMITKYLPMEELGWVFDETSLAKNPASKRAKVAMDMTKHAHYVLCLNGTPLAQGPQDLWSQQFIYDRGSTWGVSYNKFEADWLGKVRNKLVIQKDKNMSFELMIAGTSVRYLRSEADQFSGKDKNFRYVIIPPTENMKESTDNILAGYTMASGEFQEIKTCILVTYGHLREACAGYNKFELLEGSGLYKRVRHDVDPKITWLKVFLKANPGQPVVCFTEFSESEDVLMDMLEAEGYEYSSMRQKGAKSPRGVHERAEEIRKFQEGETQVFIMKSTQAKGVTLNRIPAVEAGIGAYPVIVYLQPSWSLIDWEQSQDRCVGTDPRTKKSISTMIYALVVAGSIEKSIIDALKKKKKVAETLLADAERGGYSNPFEEMDMSKDAQGKSEGDEVFDAHEYECRYHLELSPGKKIDKKVITKALAKFPQHAEYAQYLLEKYVEE